MLEKDADRAERHRIIRRALPYERAGEVGVCFGVVNASIERQFEFVQQRWLNGGSTSKRLGRSRDPVLGSNAGDGHLVIPGETPCIAAGLDRFVRTRGGAYFFLPGRQHLEELARQRGALVAVPGGPPPVAVAPRRPTLRRLLPRFSLPSLGHSAEARTWVMIAPVERAGLADALVAKKSQLDAKLRDVAIDGRALIHYARFAVFDGFKDEPLDRSYLLFVASHDGSGVAFLPARHRAFARDPFPFDACEDFPAGGGLAAFAWFCMRHLRRAAFSFAMYEATAEEVQSSLKVKRHLLDLLVKTQADPAAFPSSYEKFLAAVARYL